MPPLVQDGRAIHAPRRSDVLFGLRFTICPVIRTELTKSSACAVCMDVKARQAGENFAGGAGFVC